MRNRRLRAKWSERIGPRPAAAGLVLILPCWLAGCGLNEDVAVRREFLSYDKVAIWPHFENTPSPGGLVRIHEELFLPLYMKAFPQHRLVERRDLQAVIGEQDLLPQRLDDQTRAEIRRILGVKAIVFPNYTPGCVSQLAIKAIDTATGEIVASLVVRAANDKHDGAAADLSERLIRKAIGMLKRAAVASHD